MRKILARLFRRQPRNPLDIHVSPADLSSQDVDKLLRFHRSRFGSARMEGEGDPTGGDPTGGDPQGGNNPPANDDLGFPRGVALERMTGEQREAYWKHYARQHEERVKAFGDLTPEALADLRAKADAHDELERELMSDADRKAAEAAQKAKADERAAFIPRLVRAEFKAAAAGRATPEQLNSLLEDLDLSKFLNAKGDVDEQKVAGKLESIFGAGRQSSGPTSRGLGHTTATPGKPGDAGRAMAAKRFGDKAAAGKSAS